MLGADASFADELWLVCHGYGQLASRFIRRFGVLDNGRRLLVAPEALSRFYLSGGTGPHSDEDKVGASWMTREERDAEIADQVTYLDCVCGHVLGGRDDVKLVAFGFSQGGAVVCRWAARTAFPPDRLILWGSGVPADLLEGTAIPGLARAKLTIVAGVHDAIANEARIAEHVRQLEAAGLTYHLRLFDGGHEVNGAVLDEISSLIWELNTTG